jgi:hypothetical protein
MIQSDQQYKLVTSAVLPDCNGGFAPCPALLTEAELILFLRIPEISKAENYSNVIANLKRRQELPRIYLCSKTLYPTREIMKWIVEKSTTGR